MITLFKIGPITIDFSSFLAFFTGIAFGFLLLLLIYFYAVIRSINKDLKLRKADEEDIDEEEIKWLIEESQKTFKNKETRKEVGFAPLLIRELKELSYDIAKKFYPNSQYPYLELTIDESIALVHYVTNRVDELLDSKIIKMFRGMTIRRIVELNNAKTKIEESRVVKTAKKHKISKIFSATLGVLNAVNPFYWFKKVTVDKAVNTIIVKIGLSVIAITGEETYKIYSKKVFDKEVDLQTNVDDLYDELQKEFKDLEKDGVE